MNKMIRLAVLLALALTCMIACFALAEDTTAEAAILEETVEVVPETEDVLVASAYGGELTLYKTEAQKIYDEQLAAYIAYYTSYGYPVSEYDEETQQQIANTVITQEMQQRVIIHYAQQQGYELTAEKDEEMKATAQGYESSYRQYVESYLSGYGVAGEELEAAVQDALKEQGCDYETIYKTLKLYDIVEYVYDLSTADVTITEDEVTEAYNEKLAAQVESYADVDTFINAKMNGEDILYTPEGMRVLHILYVAQGDEATSDEPATLETAVGSEKLALLQAKIAEGTALEDLASYDESGSLMEDGTMMDYIIGEGNQTYGDEFTGAAMALTLGETSEPLLLGEGWYLIKYASDLPAGSVELSTRLEAETQEALDNKKGTVYADYVDQAIAGAKIQLDDLTCLYHIETVVNDYGILTSGAELTDAPAGKTVATAAAGASVQVLGKIAVDGKDYDFVTVPGTNFKGYVPASALTDALEEAALAVDNTALMTAAEAEAANPIFTIVMNDGSVVYGELYPEKAPESVGNFAALADSGYYDGLTFHRVIAGFMIQGGDPTGNGTGGPGYSIKGEFSSNGVENDLSHTRGVLSMARSSAPDSAGSQFFIMHADAPHLDGQYAAFGMVLGGMDTVDVIASTPTDSNDKPVATQKMRTVWVETHGQEYSFEKLAD